MRTLLRFSFFGLLLIALPAHATKYAGEFLKAPIGARAIGMGGAFVAVADDATAPYWNPAGMVYLPYREILPQHAERFGSLVNHDYLGAVIPIGAKNARRLALGAGFVRLAVDDIPVTPRPGDLRPAVDFVDGGLDGDISTNDPGNLDGVWQPGERLLDLTLYRASSSDMAFLASIAFQRNSHWAYGANVKFLRQSVPDTLPGEHVTSFGAGLDAGMLYMPTDAVTIGVVVHDLTTTYLSWSNGTRELIVPTLDTGAALNFYPAEHHALTMALDLAWGFEDRELGSQASLGAVTLDFRTGVEYWFRNTLALRTGANGKDLAFGAGLRYRHFGVDYASSLNRFFASGLDEFQREEDLEATHLVSASYAW
ncbi:MAG: hypothetical protein HOP12_11140 [Candidatus Eisenbacteria bacterium]|uniref:Uncharacterized protein n=1 Tax=Eiseniibacteriota bacterium TaxID=2212470 RepID=A0A849T047_UNCEI|nr:hypothetical protein [Candidatus Eisenbacteria bacterium]